MISDVPTGVHNVRASKIGYYTASKTVTLNEDETITVDFQLSRIIIPPITPPELPACSLCFNGYGIGMTPERLTGLPGMIWIFEGPEYTKDSIPSIIPTEINAKNSNEEGAIEFSEAVGVTHSVSIGDLIGLPFPTSISIGVGLADILEIPIGDLWIGEFDPK